MPRLPAPHRFLQKEEIKKNNLPSNVAEGYVDVIRKLSRSGTSASPSGNLFATGKQLAERVPLALKHFAEEAQVSPS